MQFIQSYHRLALCPILLTCPRYFPQARMKPLLHPSSIFFFLLTSIISINIPTSVSGDDSKNQNCSQPFSCGSFSDIKYPFWGGNRAEYCGQPNFQLECEGNAPKIIINSIKYRILALDPAKQDLTVARDDFWETICSSDYKNNTFDSTPFQYVDGLANVTLLYDCFNTPQLPASAGSPHSQDCNNGGTTTKVYYAPQIINVAICKSVIIPILEAQIQAVNANRIQDALNAGFRLNWSPNHDECNTCIHSGGECGYDQNSSQFACFTASGSSPKWNWQRKTAIGASAAGAGVLVILIMIICNRKRCLSLAQRRIFKKTDAFVDHNVEDFIKSYGSLAPRQYSYSEVKRMTNSFLGKLGQGGYGVVYKASLPDGLHVAVKVISESKGNGEEFINEVASISRTSHVNIVSLLGFCYERNKRALIYEFMPNGSLDNFIYKRGSTNAICNLDWNTLYKIAIGIARGLEYLHQGCNTRILHLDIKPQNILLDEDFCPKISDFGLAKICKKKESIVSILGTRGTIGYIAPEVFSRTFGGVSHKSDVYSYGMLILEMVGGRKNYDSGGSHNSEMYFPDWIYRDLEQGNIPASWLLITEEENEMVRKMTLVSLWCIQPNPTDRPSMSKVVEMLEGPLELVPFPPKPVLYSPAGSSLRFFDISSSNMNETNSIATIKDGSIESNEVNKDTKVNVM